MSEKPMSGQSRTDWNRVDALDDQSIDTSDCPPIPASMLKDSVLIVPGGKSHVTVPVDTDVVFWFMSQGPDWLEKMNAALGAYAEAHRCESGPGPQDSIERPKDLEGRFHEAMLRIYRRALSEANYKAARFLHMVGDRGGLQAARMLLHDQAVSEGFSALWERKRLDLTVEAEIVDHPEWHPLFTAEEIEIARRRLTQYNYRPSAA